MIISFAWIYRVGKYFGIFNLLRKSIVFELCQNRAKLSDHNQIAVCSLKKEKCLFVQLKLIPIYLFTLCKQTICFKDKL